MRFPWDASVLLAMNDEPTITRIDVVRIPIAPSSRSSPLEPPSGGQVGYPLPAYPESCRIGDRVRAKASRQPR